jgi:hypothetical protein
MPEGKDDYYWPRRKNFEEIIILQRYVAECLENLIAFCLATEV